MTGVLDWGIGGLSVVRALRAAGHTMPLRYVSDAGYPPYGKVAPQVLRERLRRLARWFHDQGEQEVLVACNAASAALPDDVTDWGSGHARLRSILPAGVQAVTQASALVARDGLVAVGVLGGAGTIASGHYQWRLQALGLTVHAVVAQPLSALVEAGQLDGPEVEAAVAAVLAQLPAVPAVLLACTHYPALLPVFARLRPEVRWLDPAPFLLPERLVRGASQLDCWTSGDPLAMQQSARAAFGLVLPEPQPLVLA